MEKILKSSKPASFFEESFLIGNGSLGGAVYGSPNTDRISLNLDTLWSGLPEGALEDKSEVTKEIQRLVISGEIDKAQTLASEKFFGNESAKYLPLGNLYIKTEADYQEYFRTLDMETGVVSVSYKVGETTYKREYFASYPDKVIAIRITADKPNSVSFELSFETPLRSMQSVNDGSLEINGECPLNVTDGKDKTTLTYDFFGEKGITFTKITKVLADNVKKLGDNIIVENANEAVIFVTAESSYDKLRNISDEFKDHRGICKKRIENLNDFEEVKARHIDDFSTLFDRVSFNLNGKHSDFDTEVRLMGFDGSDVGLYELLFNFGRYLMISGSRKGSEAMNLQGIWNEKTYAPWRSNLTTNINTEMNYWPTFSVNLAECFEPFIYQLQKMRVTGSETAKKIYGAKGFAAHHNSDIWGKTSPNSSGMEKSACQWAYWNMAGAWMAVESFDKYEYTLDKSYLEKVIYPGLKEAAEFILDMLIESDEGYILCPTTSPENTYILNGESFSLSVTTMMTESIIKELFDRVIKSTEILGIDKDFAERIKAVKLPDYRADSKGRMLEWDKEYEETDVKHRHISHLFSLYPGELISVDKTPKYAEMCEKSLEARGDDGTGWSLSWKVNCFAKLHKGDHALKILNNQLRLVTAGGEANFLKGGGTYPNMLDAHPPFQIDGNFGIIAGISNMLLQSKIGEITLLPALPKLWESGSIKGLISKGNIEVSFSWEGGTVKSLTLSSKIPQKVILKFNEKTEEILVSENTKVL